MNWFKRYLWGCLIAVLVLSAIDSYSHPGEHARYDAILLASAGWPVVAALIVGSTIGGVVHDVNHGKAG